MNKGKEMISKLHILYVGDLIEGGTCRQRKQAMQDLGHDVKNVSTSSTMKPSWHIGLYQRVQYHLGFPSDISNQDYYQRHFTAEKIASTFLNSINCR